MTATPAPKPAPKPGDIAEIPPFAIYRSKVAAWEDGTIKLLYTRLKGQGARVLVEELPGEEPVELGNKYQLTLVRIAEGEPVPPVDLPTWPVLPKPPLEMLPEPIEPPIYEKPIGIEPPIYEKPGYPGVEPPIYEKPPEGVTPEVPPYDPQPK